MDWPPRLRPLAFGGDYNAEQWDESVWDEDMRLMKEAGVTAATVGVFAWSLLEPAEGRYDFAWLERLLGRLHDTGIAACLATPTAAPPPWFTHRYPESRPVTEDGVVLGGGARETFCPSSPAYREAATRIAARLAERFGDHPALALWHVGNEYGAHVAACYCDVCAAAFRTWLGDRYGDLATLNEAWGTTFWGQVYHRWAEIAPPRRAPMPVNPAQRLDYLRFSCDQHLACYRAEREVLRPSGVPVTTNFMPISCKEMDYWRWAREVDVIAVDHYLRAEAAEPYIGLAMAADLSRSLAGGRPWLLMEHSTGAVNWQPRNIAKAPGEMRRNTVAHVARGADGAMFFQWRASRFGMEKFHSAMLPQGGTGTRLWRDVAGLGAELGALAEVQGSEVRGDVALVWDWESWWALGLQQSPSVELGFRDRMDAFYAALWKAHVVTDFLPPGAPADGYPLVIVPSLYVTSAATAAALRAYVEGGGCLLVSYFSGIVDERDTVHPGPYPGALRELLGLRVDEFHPLRSGERAVIEGGIDADAWSEEVVLDGAEPVLRFRTGPDAGRPALTRHRLGSGQAWYLAARPDEAGLGAVLGRVLAAAGVTPPRLPAGVEVVRRRRGDASYLFVINHSGAAATVPALGTDLLSGARYDGSVPASGVAVIRED